MSDSIKNKVSSNSGSLLSNILDISNVSQRVCAENMGFHDKYLSNYIYKEGVSKFDGVFAYKFLASIYHELSINRSDITVVDEFDKIIKDENNINYGLKTKLLIPALEYHILALAKIDKKIFDDSLEKIQDHYIQQIYPFETISYEKFLKDMDYEQEGYKNIENLKLVIYESQELKFGYENDFSKYLKFEKKVESINNFYSFCEKEREKYLPSFYSPSDFRELEIPQFQKKGNFLIKRSQINNLKKANISGQFTFEPKTENKLTKNTHLFYHDGTKKGSFGEEYHEIDLPEIQNKNINKMNEEVQKIVKETEKLIIENKKLKEELLKYKEPFLDPNKENEQKKDLKKLDAKGKKITLVDIDWLVNKYGNTRIIRDFVNKFGLIKLDEPEDEKIDLFEDDEKIIQSKEEKKRA
tara:strand:- start:4072 stop:5307 length:1236 start_codon:yes stop_codon:yes gene_type:complete